MLYGIFSICLFLLAVVQIVLIIKTFWSKGKWIEYYSIISFLSLPQVFVLLVGTGKLLWNVSGFPDFSFPIGWITYSGWLGVMCWFLLVIGGVLGIILSALLLIAYCFDDKEPEYYKNYWFLAVGLCAVLLPLVIDTMGAYAILGGWPGIFKIGVLIGIGYIISFPTAIFCALWSKRKEKA